MTPGRKFSTTTSAVATSRRAASHPPGDFRSSTMLFLPAFNWPKLVLAPSRNGGRVRIMSPSGASILITSAPRSASIRPQCGPAIVVVKSATRRPAKALVIGFLLPEPKRQGRDQVGNVKPRSRRPPRCGLRLGGFGAKRAAVNPREDQHGISQHPGGNGHLSRPRRRARRRLLRAPEQ